ncbi:MAG: cupin domain-containing protein, partial [Pseudomonadota bacterium]|nr:cupin domain-containing protein [Pseudomonadota bacterium]MDQ2764820.1 cupin domain-containing protein [Pseudomonadota bacterium]
VRWSRVILSSPTANMHLLRVAAGKRLPVHGHRGGELSQVLYGAYTDCNERFGVGDFVQADDADHHQPVVTTESECICLISVEGHIAFNGPLVRVLGALLGM